MPTYLRPLVFEPAPEQPPLVAVSNLVFQCSPADLPDVFRYLCQLGYGEKAPTSQHEYCRLFDRGALIILYRTGKIVCAGSEASRAAQLLRAGCVEQVTLPLEWREVAR